MALSEDEPAKPEPQKPRLRPLPAIRDFVLCEKIINDRIQGKFTLVDVFEDIQAPAFPTRMQLWYYCTLTSGHGELDFEVLLHNVSTGKKVLIWKGCYKLDPVKTAALINLVQPIFEAPGLYEFILKAADGRLIGTRTVTVKNAPNAQAPVI